MTLHARIPAAELNGATPLYRDFISPAASPIREWLPWYGPGATWGEGKPRAVDGALVSSLTAYNEALGVDAAVISRLRGLADGSVRAVVTGQQPGVMGGPLMSLYKAASAIALARAIEEKSAQPCVPVFWMGSDDDDFAEVRELSVLGADLSRLDVSIDGAAYRPGLRVGDIGAPAVRAVWGAVSPALPSSGDSRERLGAMLDGARDFGDVAARAMVAATAGRIAILDGRAPELRDAGRDLLLAFFDRETALRALVEEGSRALESRGYHAQVQWGADSGLFRVENGVRQRVPAEHRAAVRAEFARDIRLVSPGVIARNLLQDAVLSPLAVVLGPAEIAYRAQMTGVYREMKVDHPVVLPRLSATYLPPAVRDMTRDIAVDAGALALDPAAIAGAVSNHSTDGGLKSAAAQLESAFAAATRLFLDEAGARLDEKARQKLQKRIDEISGRLTQTLSTALEHDTQGPRSRWPFLPRMGDMFRKDSMAQERFLALVVPMLFHGDDAWRSIDEMSAQWAVDALDGRTWHGVYSV